MDYRSRAANNNWFCSEYLHIYYCLTLRVKASYDKKSTFFLNVRSSLKLLRYLQVRWACSHAQPTCSSVVHCPLTTRQDFVWTSKARCSMANTLPNVVLEVVRCLQILQPVPVCRIKVSGIWTKVPSTTTSNARWSSSAVRRRSSTATSTPCISRRPNLPPLPNTRVCFDHCGKGTQGLEQWFSNFSARWTSVKACNFL